MTISVDIYFQSTSHQPVYKYFGYHRDIFQIHNYCKCYCYSSHRSGASCYTERIIHLPNYSYPNPKDNAPKH